MSLPIDQFVAEQLAELDPADPDFAPQAVDRLLAAARAWQASDLHLTPSVEGLDARFRVDGALQSAGTFPDGVATNVVARLKVLAGLLTYRTDLPQEGRIRTDEDDVEMRVSTFPTLHGERAVVRLFGSSRRYQRLNDLGYPDDARDQLGRMLAETSGVILVTGPAGSGKTTTLYACLRELTAETPVPRCLVSIEDPIEVAVAGVAQSQVNETVELDLARGLRHLMRQDPEVILVGEIRDAATAEAAFGASLTGHLLLSSFHAGSSSEAIGRLADMGIEPYILRSTILAILSQRLVRTLCECSQPCEDAEARLGLPVERFRLPVGCDACRGTGYRGRMVLVEMLSPRESDMRGLLLARTDTTELERQAIASGMITRWQRAITAIEAGRTSPAEVRRVLGLGGSVPLPTC